MSRGSIVVLRRWAVLLFLSFKFVLRFYFILSLHFGEDFSELFGMNSVFFFILFFRFGDFVGFADFPGCFGYSVEGGADFPLIFLDFVVVVDFGSELLVVLMHFFILPDFVVVDIDDL